MTEERIDYLYKYRSLYSYWKDIIDTKTGEIVKKVKVEKPIINKFTFDLLTKGEIYFSSPREFNDPFDCWVPIKSYPITAEMVQNALSDNTKRYKSKRDKLRFIIKEEFNNDINKYVEKVNINNLDENSNCIEDNNNFFINDYYISCFSKRNDKTLMWSHYADCHTGICIGFKTHYLKGVNALDLNLNVNSGLATINKVKYREDNHKPTILSRMELTKEDLMNGFLSKAKEWTYEEEYRVILSPQMTYSQKQYIASKYIKEIYFGMRTSEEIIKHTIKEISKSNFLEIDLINFYKMRECKNEFSIIPIKINYKEYLI